MSGEDRPAVAVLNTDSDMVKSDSECCKREVRLKSVEEC